jgi:hypothetical protein
LLRGELRELVLSLSHQHAVRLQQVRLVIWRLFSKINSAVLLKTQSDIGLPNFSQLLLAQQDDKLAISHYLRIVILEAGGQNLDVSIGSYDNIYRFLAH